MFKYESELSVNTNRVVNSDTGEVVDKYQTIPELPQVLEFVSRVLPLQLSMSQDTGTAIQRSFDILKQTLEIYEERYITTSIITQSMLDRMAQAAAAGELGNAPATEAPKPSDQVAEGEQA